LIPKIVVQVESEEEEVQKIILLSNETKIPITFRAAGTSLSGFFLNSSKLFFEVAPYFQTKDKL
jgi:D-lactate dehydrogenase